MTAADFSPDGTVLMTGGNDGRVEFDSVATAAEVHTPLDVPSQVWSVHYNPAGDRVVVATVTTGATVTDLDQGTTSSLGPGSKGDADWSPDGTCLVVGGNGTVAVFDAASPSTVRASFDAQTGTASPRFAPDGRILVGGSTGPTTLWDLDGQSVLYRSVPGAPTYVFPLPGGQLVAVPDMADSVSLRPATNLTPTGPQLSPGPAPLIPPALPTTFAASYYNGDRIAVVNRAGDLQVYETASGQPVGDLHHLGFPTIYAVFSRDMNTIAAGGREGEVALVDLQTGKVRVLDSVLTNWVDALAFSPDGDLLAADMGHAVIFHDLDQPEPGTRDLSRFTHASGDPIGADLSPDGGTLAIADGGSVTFVDLADEQPIGPPVQLTTDTIWWLAYSPDGSMVVVADEGHSSRLLDVATHQPVGPRLPIADYAGPVFNSDATILGTSTPNGGALLAVDPVVWRREACSLAGRNLTEDEWVRYLPSVGPRQATCPQYS